MQGMEHRHSLIDLLTPSWLGIFLYAVATLLILVGSATTPIIDSVSTPDTKRYIGGAFQHYIAAMLQQINQSQAIGRVTVYLLWAGFGALVYIALWMLINWYVSVQNGLVVGFTFTT